jgi:uncharacterized protein
MRCMLRRLSAGLFFMLSLVGTATAQDATGDWIGVISVSPALQLHIGLHVAKTADGYTGTIDSPDQGGYDTPLAQLTVAEDALSFAVPTVKGSYAGKFNPSTSTWEGTWSLGSRTWPLNFVHGVIPPRPVVEGLDGDWDGALDVGAGMKLRLAFHIKTGPHGTIGTLDSIDQQAMGIGVSNIARNDAQVNLEIHAAGASYQGTLDPSGHAITGQWQQGGRTMPLILMLRPANQAQVILKRPQMPVKPYPYREEDVGFDNAAEHVHLAGTLTLPQGSGPFPAVILVAGSGPNTRDEPIMGHRLFLVIADHLTRHGIAVLRFDKRGTGSSTGDYATATTVDFAHDVAAGVAYLRTRQDIDQKHVGLIGHSEGGLIVPMVAVHEPSIAYIVMMAGTGVNGAEVWIEQLRLILKASNMSDASVAVALSQRHAIVDILRSEKDPTIAATKLRALLTKLSPSQADGVIATLNTEWFRDFFAYDPGPTLRMVRCPVLALDGSKDLQVSASQNLPAIRAALVNNPNAEVVELPGLNHLFQTATTGSPSEYGQIEETIAPLALDAITNWITQRD